MPERSLPPLPKILVATGLLLPGSMALAQTDTTPTLTPPAIVDAVENEFRHDPFVPYDRIDTRIDDRTVVLSGTVGNLLARERATRLARGVRGVAAVDNNLQVAPARQPGDATLVDRIDAALTSNPATEAAEIRVTADDGAVSLHGTVQSWQEKHLAAQVAKQVHGVTALDNRLQVAIGTERPDEEIAADIRQRLRFDPYVDADNLQVKVFRGRVILNGAVASAAEKAQTYGLAWIKGVAEVDHGGLVVVDPDTGKTTAAAIEPPTDAAIRAAIDSALGLDPRVDVDRVEVTVNGGEVVLRGVVESLQARRAAHQAARTRVGVRDVDNRLKVRPPRRGDATLSRVLNQALDRHYLLGPFEVTASVEDGTAFLSGLVDSFREKRAADEVTAAIQGIREIVNIIQVDRPTEPLVYDPLVDDYQIIPEDYAWYDYDPPYNRQDDAEIRESIREELWWSPFVDAGGVRVMVDDGFVTLTGSVESALASEAAVENAFEGGAVWVDNQLDID